MKNPLSIFKPSKSNNPSWNLTKTFLQTTVFWFIFLYLLPAVILKIETTFQIKGFEPLQEIGWILFCFFSLIGIYSGYTMSWFGNGTPLPLDCPSELVIEGPYRFVRNPMAVAGIGQGVCVGIIVGSYLVVLYALSGAVLWHILVRPVEEEDLEVRFGKSYTDYKRAVKCWIPRFR